MQTAAAEPDRVNVNAGGMDQQIVREMNETAYLKAFGIENPSGDPVTPHTLFNTASIGKTITAMAGIQLVDAGKIDLGRPVRDYLPSSQ